MSKYKMKDKTLAVLGIGTYVLSVLSSAENLEGIPTAPIILVLISGVATAVFVIMAIVRLWEEAKNLSIALGSSALGLFILTAIQEWTSQSYGSPTIILSNIFRVIYLITFVWAIVKLMKNNVKHRK